MQLVIRAAAESRIDYRTRISKRQVATRCEHLEQTSITNLKHAKT